MKVTELELPGVLLFEPDVYGDERGFFPETWNEARYGSSPIGNVSFVQDNVSRSIHGVLRGLHFQRNFPQGKLVQVTSGTVFDVAVDIRIGSPYFGRWTGCELSDENHLQLWIPPGFAHGFCVVSDQADFTYKCTVQYRANDDAGIAWNDPDIGIEWPIRDPLLSARDSGLPTLDEARKLGHLPVFDS